MKIRYSDLKKEFGGIVLDAFTDWFRVKLIRNCGLLKVYIRHHCLTLEW